jgi:hypothetical protein
LSTQQAAIHLTHATWRKSSRSSQGGDKGNCVEVAFAGSVIAVRDSKSPGGGELVLLAAGWTGLLDDLRG